MFFDSGYAILRTVVVGSLAYTSLVILLRVSGKRTLSKMNAFDLVVTVALGSALSSTLLFEEISLVQGATAFALLIGLQLLITWSSVRVRGVRRLVTGEPSLVLYRGEFLPETMKRVRLTEDEVRSAVRSQGLARLEEADAVVLETDGSVSVVRGGGPESSAMVHVRHAGEDENVFGSPAGGP